MSAQIYMLLESRFSNIKYTNYKPIHDAPYRLYSGFITTFQKGMASGVTKTFKNEDGEIKIETSTWKNDKISKTPTTIRDPKNWDTTKKCFERAMITFGPDFSKDIAIPNVKLVVIKYDDEKRYLKPGQTLQFSKTKPYIIIK